ncbi:MAG: 50S ribosomal protein L23 [Actinobacteria bacterium]|nr:MAG: 50S ribosomal protein L23 [Actinomycetota bacterium]
MQSRPRHPSRRPPRSRPDGRPPRRDHRAGREGVYTFIVHPDANRIEIRTAVEEIFGVRVAKVNTLNRRGKRKRNRKSFSFGSRSNTKRAIVTLAAGDRIDLFEGG